MLVGSAWKYSIRETGLAGGASTGFTGGGGGGGGGGVFFLHPDEMRRMVQRTMIHLDSLLFIW
jgi:hypothetical protein